MTSWKELDNLRKILVLILAIFTLLVVGAYLLWGSQKGIDYEGHFLVKTREGGSDVYTGKWGGERLRFTVTGKSVLFENGAESIMYTITKDPTAAPEDWPIDYGLEIRQGEDVLFRGSCTPNFNWWTWQDNEAEKPLPSSVTTACGLALDPERIITYRADIEMLAYGLLSALLAVGLIFYADALFRFNLSFSIKNVDQVEPSGWELFTRTACQVALTLCALVFYVLCFIHL